VTAPGSSFLTMVVVGTRPDALKMYPVYRGLQVAGMKAVVVATAQHNELLDSVFGELQFKPDYNLGVMLEDQQLPGLTARLFIGIEEAICKISPDLVLVQGDTTSSMVGALVAYYHRIPVGHVEAGLRTGDPYRPFPEEANRRIISQVADFHFAPTRRAKRNLLSEGIKCGKVLVTGNTAIDTLLATLERGPVVRDRRLKEILAGDDTLISVTAHRRESFGAPMQELIGALTEISGHLPGVRIIYPVHPNPSVRGPVTRGLESMNRIDLLEPLRYGDLVRLLRASWLILTDSGGIQEEAPSLGKPVLVLRDKTERLESIEAGIARLVGMDREAIVQAVFSLFRDRKAYESMIPRCNPYGDGRAAERIVRLIRARFLGNEVATEEFKDPSIELEAVDCE